MDNYENSEFLKWKEENKTEKNKLKDLVNEMLRNEDIKIGDIVTWKSGLKNKKYPNENQPAYVLDVCDDSLIDNKLHKRDVGSAYFTEQLNLKLAFLDQENDLTVYLYDKSRFRVIEKA